MEDALNSLLEKLMAMLRIVAYEFEAEQCTITYAKQLLGGACAVLKAFESLYSDQNSQRQMYTFFSAQHGNNQRYMTEM